MFVALCWLAATAAARRSKIERRCEVVPQVQDCKIWIQVVRICAFKIVAIEHFARRRWQYFESWDGCTIGAFLASHDENGAIGHGHGWQNGLAS